MTETNVAFTFDILWLTWPFIVRYGERVSESIIQYPWTRPLNERCGRDRTLPSSTRCTFTFRVRHIWALRTWYGYLMEGEISSHSLVHSIWWCQVTMKTRTCKLFGRQNGNWVDSHVSFEENRVVKLDFKMKLMHEYMYIHITICIQLKNITSSYSPKSVQSYTDFNWLHSST